MTIYKLNTMKEKWSGERLETFIYSRDAVEHLHRYAIAKDIVEDKVVLDIACGEGYGSYLMSKNSRFVYGVDIDSKSVDAAKIKYKEGNLEFRIGTVDAIPLNDNSVDIVTSFETLEHHELHNEMMVEIKRVLKPSGCAIISTPDKLYYSDERNFKNEFHKKELYKEEFVSLVERHFNFNQMLNQIFVNGNSIIQVDNDDHKIELIYKGDYTILDEVKISPLYMIAIVSDVGFKMLSPSVFDGSQITEKKIIDIKSDIYKSNSYKIGHLLLSPYRLVKTILK